MSIPPNAATVRILDAALNRASEGLRVVEDYLRMVLDDGHLARRAKQLRHDLAAAAAGLSAELRLATRDTLGDVGTRNSTAAEGVRRSPLDVATASFHRTAEALRSIEEYGKLVDSQLAAHCESIRYQLYTLEKATCTTSASLERLAEARLYVLVDGGSSERAFGELADALVAAGADVLQLRDKRLSDRALLGRATRLVAATRGTPALAIVNDRADIATAAHAHGVHLGQDELPVAAARRLVGAEMLIGVSTHSIAEARQAVLEGANYLGAGPTFASSTKQFDDFPGLEYLREVSSEVSLPTFAIGGITTENIQQVLETGVTRVAVAGAIASAVEPATMVAKLRRLLADSPAANPATPV